MEAAERELERVFAHIAATRMAGLPVVNPALHVAAVGFRAWQGCRVGVLVTPWSLSLVLLPGAHAAPRRLLPDERQTWDFPSGSYAFMGMQESALGLAQMCPLLSPLPEFGAQQEAVAAAEAVMAALFAPASADAALAERMEGARLRGESVAREEVSRRDFLRMPWLGR